MRKTVNCFAILVVLISISLLSACGQARCAVESCNEVVKNDSQYCFLHKCLECDRRRVEVPDAYCFYCTVHKCSVDGCTELRYQPGKSYYGIGGVDLYPNAKGRYCEEHARKYEAAIAPSSNLRFSDISIEHNSSYTVCTGKLNNVGIVTYKFVKVRGAFKGNDGSVLDTDWTYGVGSESLKPGESTSFRLSCPLNRKITTCSVSTFDYNIVSVDESSIRFH